MRVVWAISFALVMLLPIFSSAVRAEVDLAQSTQEVLFESGISTTNSTTINLMDKSTYRYEKDVVFADLPDVEGKYYGPYLQSSTLEFNHEGDLFQFVTNFTIGPSTIMNGVSEFWLRVPVMPYQYESWHIWCNWGYGKTFEIPSDSLFVAPYDVLFPGTELTRTWFPWSLYSDDSFDETGWTYYAYYRGFDNAPGNFWKPQAETYDILERDSGIYLKLQGIFKPNEQFLVSFTGQLREGERPRVFLSSDDFSLDQSQVFRFYNYWKLDDSGFLSFWEYLAFHPDVCGITFEENQTMDLMPAWAFVFVSGIGRDGMTSYRLRFADSDDYVTFPVRLESFTNGSYISLYFPYSVLQQYDTGPEGYMRNLDWSVEMALRTTGDPEYYFDVGGSPYYTRTFTVTTTVGYLLCTCPNPVYFDDGWTGPVILDVSVRPLTPCTLLFFGADISCPWSPGIPGQEIYQYPNNFSEYHHEDQRASWDSGTGVNAHILPLFKNVNETMALWAQVTETSYYTVYDFGWGIGYEFPGDTNIYMFLDGGGQYLYDGTYADFAEMVYDNRSFWQKLLDWFYELGGWIWDGLMWIWEQIVSFGTWIYNVLVEIIGWIVSVVKDIAGKVSHIIEGMLYGIPILVVLFVVNYAGQMLYTGRLPRLGKERRLYRKIKRGPFKTKTYRKIKHLREATPYLGKKRLRNAPGYVSSMPARYRTWRKYSWNKASRGPTDADIRRTERMRRSKTRERIREIESESRRRERARRNR